MTDKEIELTPRNQTVRRKVKVHDGTLWNVKKKEFKWKLRLIVKYVSISNFCGGYDVFRSEFCRLYCTTKRNVAFH